MRWPRRVKDPPPGRGDAARNPASGRRHTSDAPGTTNRQAVGGYPSKPRQYSHKDPRIVSALRQIAGQHRCDDRTAAVHILQHGYARKRGDGWHITEEGRFYLKHGRHDDD